MIYEFSKEQLANLYRKGNAEIRKELKEILGEELTSAIPIHERVRTFEDAVAELSEVHETVRAYQELKCKLGKENADILAYLKLRVITAALNEGWIPKFSEDEYRYYPRFIIYTQEEIQSMSEEEKEKIGLVLWGGAAYDGSHAGLVYARSRNAFSYSCSNDAARLAYKSAELALYAAKQFLEIYADYHLIPRSGMTNSQIE